MLVKGKRFFSKGAEKFTRYRKLKMIFGLFSKGGTGLKDLFGRRGAQFLRQGDAMVVGTGSYTFKQFQKSPYVRYPKLALYQVRA